MNLQGVRSTLLTLAIVLCSTADIARGGDDGWGDFKTADELFEAGKFAEALEAYRGVNVKTGDYHLTVWISFYAGLKVAACLDHLKRWPEAAIAYLHAADNRQVGTHFPQQMEAVCRLADMYRQAGRERELRAFVADYEAVILTAFKAQRQDPAVQMSQQLSKEAQLSNVIARLDSPAVVKVSSNVAAFLQSLPNVPRGTVLPASYLPTNVFFVVRPDHGASLVPMRVAFNRMKQLLDAGQMEQKKSFVRFVAGRVGTPSLWQQRIELGEGDGLRDAFLPLIFASSCHYVSAADSRVFTMRQMKHVREPDDRIGEHKLISPSGETNILYLDSREMQELYPQR